MRRSGCKGGLFAAVLLVAGAALAQGSPREERLYVGEGALMGSNRMVALGGAYVAVAEGASGFTSNLAALAQRAPDNDRGWDVAFLLSWQDLPLVDASARDLDNDGRGDGATTSTHFLVGLSLQYQRFGVGTWVRSSVQSFCPDGGLTCADGERIQATVQHAALAGAFGVGREDLILGFALEAEQASFVQGGARFDYDGGGFEIDALYRPFGEPFRLGLSLRPEIEGRLRPGAPTSLEIAGRPPFRAIVSPGVMSLGASLRLGAGAHRYNRLSPAARADLARRFGEASLPPPLPADAPDGRLLLSAQLALIAPATHAVPLDSVVADPSSGLPEVGSTLLLEPRFGVEHETLPRRLRLRAGGYVEPAPFLEVGGLRPHLTGGAELLLFHYYDDWALSASFDLAARYHAYGIAIGFWR